MLWHADCWVQALKPQSCSFRPGIENSVFPPPGQRMKSVFWFRWDDFRDNHRGISQPARSLLLCLYWSWWKFNMSLPSSEKTFAGSSRLGVLGMDSFYFHSTPLWPVARSLPSFPHTTKDKASLLILPVCLCQGKRCVCVCVCVSWMGIGLSSEVNSVLFSLFPSVFPTSPSDKPNEDPPELVSQIVLLCQWCGVGRRWRERGGGC